MPRIFGRVFGKASALAKARAAELRGDLAPATVLFAQAGRLDEAARVMVLRGDAESDGATRVRHYTQAIATAPKGSGVSVHALRKRAGAVLSIAENAPIAPAAKQDVWQAARDLESIGEYGRAADAYACADDVEGQTRALTRAGDIDRLDVLLAERQGIEREAASRRQAADQLSALLAIGRRREAAAIARASGDEALRHRGRSIERGRIGGSVVRAVLGGKELLIAIGDEIVIGRGGESARGASLPHASPSRPSHDETRHAGAVLTVASAAVSRRHLALFRSRGAPTVRDLESRNGTSLGGAKLIGETAVADGVELRLGGEVPVVVRPSADLPGALAVDVAGARYLAQLGPAILGIGRWSLRVGEDGWVELSTEDEPPAFAGPLRLSDRVSLVAGDCLAVERGGVPLFEVRAYGR
jgi:FHA domain